jgi:hypothetical protein
MDSRHYVYVSFVGDIEMRCYSYFSCLIICAISLNSRMDSKIHCTVVKVFNGSSKCCSQKPCLSLPVGWRLHKLQPYVGTKSDKALLRAGHTYASLAHLSTCVWFVWYRLFMLHVARFCCTALESVIDVRMIYLSRLRRKSEEQHCWLWVNSRHFINWRGCWASNENKQPLYTMF